ncbi:hypothetical protein [Streptomyces profundus]|uniref:hypothetical protein n=1 Tax=Streptomyces profundus TaxID=2867410 RepID=UPI001D1684A8|nr:hypothetical protein [Streptomyces sp. MA3_2.13]UED86431.1 hypothetical protein K4G22_21390 [Streptomyces sp. MA3_2.13]
MASRRQDGLVIADMAESQEENTSSSEADGSDERPSSEEGQETTPLDRLRARLRARNAASEANYRIKSGGLP